MTKRGRGAAFFDADGTLMRTHIGMYYLHIATRGMSPIQRALWIAAAAPRALGYLVLDQVNRGRFNRVFYRNYRHLTPAEAKGQAEAILNEVIEPRLFPAALERIAEHHEHGEPVVIVSGSLDFLVAPLARRLGAAAALTAVLAEENGRFTGELQGAPVSGPEKARLARAWARDRVIDLEASTAYGDSTADLDLLRLVGHPVAVNPSPKLRKIAREAGWPIERWRVADRALASGGPRVSAAGA
ncbi:MAG TPA: HAD-IB family hydrolase [Candidatus Udaeobacter sp.]|nr:HAD-IB family hydrolase [Candidatus Udaeobacter sp.]